MKICILSDSHDNISLLCTAVAQAKQQGAMVVLHCGDVVAPSTLRKLQGYALPVYAIHGNNTGDLYKLSKLNEDSKGLIHYCGQDADITLASRRIFMVHYPHYARGMATTGDYDVVCCGHTHLTSIEKVKNIRGTETIVCNPGTVGTVPATYIFGDLENMTFELVGLAAV